MGTERLSLERGDLAALAAGAIAHVNECGGDAPGELLRAINAAGALLGDIPRVAPRAGRIPPALARVLAELVAYEREAFDGPAGGWPTIGEG